MIIMAMRPAPRRRSGRQIARSRPAPKNPPAIIARITAGINWIPMVTLKKKAKTAPSVTISEWAKLTRPVVP